jgi:hypothetical protein
MNTGSYISYTPLQCPKRFADEVWIVDGPEIGMRYFGLTLPFPTRMTVVRLQDRKLWVHSPVAWNDDLGAAIDRLGSVHYLIAPNTLHYSYLEPWRRRYPQARSYGPPGFDARAETPAFDEVLGEAPPQAWGDAFAQCHASNLIGPEPSCRFALDRGRFLSPVQPNAHHYRPHREFRAVARPQSLPALGHEGVRGGRPRRQGADRHATEFHRPSAGCSNSRIADDRMGTRTDRAGAWPLLFERCRGGTAARIPLGAVTGLGSSIPCCTFNRS